MEIKEIKVYNFEELEPAIKEKVIDKFRDEEEFYFLKDDLEEFIKNKLEELNYNIIEDILKEENIIETIKSNDYLFFSNGKIANNYI